MTEDWGGLSILAVKSLAAEFERQVETLLEKRYPDAAGLSVQAFLRQVEPLAKKLNKFAEFEFDLELGRLPFVLVIRNELVDTKKAMALVVREKNGES